MHTKCSSLCECSWRQSQELGLQLPHCCIAGMDWQCFRTHTDFSEHAFSHGGCSKTMGCSCRHLVVHPWALAASQSSVRGWSHAPLVFKKSPWRLQLIKKKKSLICSARRYNLSSNSPLIFDKKRYKLHLCFLFTIHSTNYRMTFTWLPSASGALNSPLNCVLTTLGQNKCLSFFSF